MNEFNGLMMSTVTSLF